MDVRTRITDAARLAVWRLDFCGRCGHVDQFPVADDDPLRAFALREYVTTVADAHRHTAHAWNVRRGPCGAIEDAVGGGGRYCDHWWFLFTRGGPPAWIALVVEPNDGGEGTHPYDALWAIVGGNARLCDPCQNHQRRRCEWVSGGVCDAPSRDDQTTIYLLAHGPKKLPLRMGEWIAVGRWTPDGVRYAEPEPAAVSDAAARSGLRTFVEEHAVRLRDTALTNQYTSWTANHFTVPGNSFENYWPGTFANAGEGSRTPVLPAPAKPTIGRRSVQCYRLRLVQCLVVRLSVRRHPYATTDGGRVFPPIGDTGKGGQGVPEGAVRIRGRAQSRDASVPIRSRRGTHSASGVRDA